MTNGGRPAILAFCAARCGPCKVLAPQLDLVSAHERGRVRVLKMDCEESPENAALSSELCIRALPTIIWVGADGAEVQRGEGPLSAKMIRKIAECRFFGGEVPQNMPARANIDLPGG